MSEGCGNRDVRFVESQQERRSKGKERPLGDTEAERLISTATAIDKDLAWLVISTPDDVHEDVIAQAAGLADQRGALLIVLPPGHTLEGISDVELERRGWIRSDKLNTWRHALEYYAAPHRPEDYLNDDGEHARLALGRPAQEPIGGTS